MEKTRQIQILNNAGFLYLTKVDSKHGEDKLLCIRADEITYMTRSENGGHIRIATKQKIGFTVIETMSDIRQQLGHTV